MWIRTRIWAKSDNRSKIWATCFFATCAGLKHQQLRPELFYKKVRHVRFLARLEPSQKRRWGILASPFSWKNSQGLADKNDLGKGR